MQKKRVSKKEIDRRFMGDVMGFPALPRVPSAGKIGCGEIPDFAQFMFFQELYKSHGR